VETATFEPVATTPGADATAIPTHTPPLPLPPSPDPFSTPSSYVSPTEPPFEVLIPDASEIKVGSDGKYFAAGPRGCPWSEVRRRPAIDPTTGQLDPDTEEIVLSNPCDDDVFLRFNPEIGAVAPFVVD
jgi:hypothetical protein